MIPIKSGSGMKVTRSLFFETAEHRQHIRFTLKDHDYEGYPSLKRLYLQHDDPTEYSFAMEVLGGLDQWEELCKCKWFQPHLKNYRYELDLRLRAAALVRIREEAGSGSKNSFQANKYLLERGWEGSKHGRGRPSKEEIRQEAQRQVNEDQQIQSDYSRLNNPVQKIVVQ